MKGKLLRMPLISTERIKQYFKNINRPGFLSKRLLRKQYRGANTDLPPITEDILGPEEMIERYLKKCGGQAYQVDIVNESDLSESKVSLVLSKMKDEGRILKIQKGKKNVIRLIKKE